MFIGKKKKTIYEKVEHYDFKWNQNFLKYNLQKKKKNGNYRLDSCFASNTSEDMLQPINKYKKKTH